MEKKTRQGNTDPGQEARAVSAYRDREMEKRMEEMKREARRGLFISSLVGLFWTLVFLMVSLIVWIPTPIRILAVILFLISLISVPLSAVALRRRYREIETGEELEAQKY